MSLRMYIETLYPHSLFLCSTVAPTTSSPSWLKQTHPYTFACIQAYSWQVESFILHTRHITLILIGFSAKFFKILKKLYCSIIAFWFVECDNYKQNWISSVLKYYWASQIMLLKIQSQQYFFEFISNFAEQMRSFSFMEEKSVTHMPHFTELQHNKTFAWVPAWPEWPECWMEWREKCAKTDILDSVW